MNFYFNHFSLIIFYHSVCLCFERFGLRVQVYCQLVQFTLACKGYDNHHCHNKPQTVNGAGVWMMSCPEQMGREFERFWKRFSWGPTMVLRSWGPTMVLRSWSPTMEVRNWVGPCRQTIEFLPLGQRMELSAIELSFPSLWWWLSFSGPNQRR